MPPIAAGLMGLGALSSMASSGSFVGNFIAQKMLEKSSEQEIGGVEQIGKEAYAGMEEAYKNAYAQLSQLKPLEIDTRYVDSMYSGAQRASERQYGRAAGEEIARDIQRQTTADALGRLQQSGSSVAERLGFLSDIDERERRGMQEISLQGIGAREARITENVNRLERAALGRADFYQKKQMAEFQDERNLAQQRIGLQQQAGLSLAELQRQNGLAILQAKQDFARTRYAGAQAMQQQQASMFQGLGSTLMSAGMYMDNRNMLSDLLGGGGE